MYIDESGMSAQDIGDDVPSVDINSAESDNGSYDANIGGHICEISDSSNNKAKLRNKIKHLEAARTTGFEDPMSGNFTTRSGRSVKPNKKYAVRVVNFIMKYALATKAGGNMSTKEAIKRFGMDATDKAINGELEQMLAKEVWRFLKKGQWNGKKVLPSSMFLKDKYDASGEFEKLKARLVCCGNFQEGVDDVESPTVGLNTVLILLSIAAKLKLVKKVFDVSGAYLNANMEEPEFMRLSKEVSAAYVKAHPEKQEFLLPDGTMVVELLKTLYGLKQPG